MALSHSASSRGFVRDPLGFVERLSAEHGPYPAFRVGRREVVVVADPEGARDVLVTQHRHFAKQNFNRTTSRGRAAEGLLMTGDPEEHRAGRRLLHPAFGREGLQRRSPRAGGGGIPRRELATGSPDRDRARDGLALREGRGPRPLLHRFDERIVRDMRDVMAASRLVVSRATQLSDLLHVRSGVRFARALQRVTAEMARLLDNPAPASVVALVAASEDPDRERLALDLFTILLAGTETTSAALSWAWAMLAHVPEEAVRLAGDTRRAEVVFAETLRLFPPAWNIGRLALVETTVGDRPISRGTMVLVCPYLIQRDPASYSAPASFDPDRWAEGWSVRRAGFTFFPFGAGPRQCIGERLAWQEATAVLAALAPVWRLDLPANARLPEPQAGLSLRPADGLRLVPVRR